MKLGKLNIKVLIVAIACINFIANRVQWQQLAVSAVYHYHRKDKECEVSVKISIELVHFFELSVSIY